MYLVNLQTREPVPGDQLFDVLGTMIEYPVRPLCCSLGPDFSLLGFVQLSEVVNSKTH